MNARKMRLVALLAALAPAAARAGADLATSVLAAALAVIPGAGTVFTADGGRLRGTILEAGPGGVSVQLADGSVRKLEAAKVTRIDFSDGTSWTPAPAAVAAVPAAAAPAAAPAPVAAPAAAPAPVAVPAAATTAAAPAATPAAAGAGAPAAAAVGATAGAAVNPPPGAAPPAGAPSAKPAAPIVLPIDRLDTVYLANGGRVRGLVVEEVPSEGVLMRLLDGTERRYKPGEVVLVHYANGTVSAQPKAGP